MPTRDVILIRRFGAAIGVILCTAIASGQQFIRDTSGPAPTGTATIAGTVLADEAPPQPLRRARVTVVGTDPLVSKSAVTDEMGRFRITDLPAGRFTVSAIKPGYVRMAYGAKRFDRPGTPVMVADGQRVADLAIRLSRGGVITGAITDETGMPSFGTRVQLLQYRPQAGGERVLAPFAPAGSVTSDMADDRGVYRLYGLPPGEYVVMATARNANIGEILAMTDAELRAATAAMQQGGAASANRQPGTPAAPPRPLPTTREGTTVGYAPVYFPGTTAAPAATPVALGAGEERVGVDFAIQTVRTAKIDGIVATPAGVSPQSVQLTLVPAGQSAAQGLAGGFGLGLGRASVGPDGRFSYSGVAPGQYTISARTGGGNAMTFSSGGGDVMSFTSILRTEGGRAGGGGANVERDAAPVPVLWGATDVTVEGQNLSNVAVSLQPPMAISGRMVFAGTRIAVPTDLTRARISLGPASSGATVVMMNSPSARIEASGKFTITNVTPGRYRLSASVPPVPNAVLGWTLKSAMANGRDVLDFPLEIGANDDVGEMVLTFTDATQQVSGMLQDPAGRPAPDFTVIVFASDNRYWTSPSRRIRTARPGTDGRFTVSNLPAGDYRIAAVVDMAPNEANDPAFLEQLVAASYRFPLAEGEKKVQDLRISAVGVGSR